MVISHAFTVYQLYSLCRDCLGFGVLGGVGTRDRGQGHKLGSK
jgi:hypothetical protein